MNLLARNLGLEVAFADRPAISPDLIDLAQHGNPILRQAAKFPRLHEHPSTARRWFDDRRPAMPHMHLGIKRGRASSTAVGGRRVGSRRATSSMLVRPAAVGRVDEPHVMPPIDQPAANRTIDDRQRVQRLKIPLPRDAQLRGLMV